VIDMKRLGYVLTDDSFKYSLLEDWFDVDPADPWIILGRQNCTAALQ